MLDTVGIELLEDFFSSIIEKVIIIDKNVTSITFKNGITHEFAYKPIEKQKNRSKQRLYYKTFEGTILQYLKEHGSAKRIDLQNLTNLNRVATTELLNELIEKGLVERRGVSVSIRYYYKGKKQ
ncbi:MarR family transcriptional regulator [Oceanobacillus sp. FSL W7-1281]|uniref:MarR family transcriptional regulator n=1 Tax=Oceanobacillus sp. FSL W7-1281 TaxID=2921698 RepID=UPI0030DBA90D